MVVGVGELLAVNDETAASGLEPVPSAELLVEPVADDGWSSITVAGLPRPAERVVSGKGEVNVLVPL